MPAEAPPPPAGSGVPSGESMSEAREIVAAKPASEAREEPDLSKLLQETSAHLIEQQVKRQKLRDLEAEELARATVAAPCFDAGSAGLSEQQQLQLKEEEEKQRSKFPWSLVDVPPQLPPQQQQQQQQLPRQKLRDLEAEELARATVAAPCFDAGSAGLSEQQQQKEEEEEEKQRSKFPGSLVDVPPQLPPQQQQQQQQQLPPQLPPLPPLPPLPSLPSLPSLASQMLQYAQKM